VSCELHRPITNPPGFGRTGSTENADKCGVRSVSCRRSVALANRCVYAQWARPTSSSRLTWHRAYLRPIQLGLGYRVAADHYRQACRLQVPVAMTAVQVLADAGLIAGLDDSSELLAMATALDARSMQERRPKRTSVFAERPNFASCPRSSARGMRDSNSGRPSLSWSRVRRAASQSTSTSPAPLPCRSYFCCRTRGKSRRPSHQPAWSDPRCAFPRNGSNYCR
jgi:hypothetical protein